MDRANAKKLSLEEKIGQMLQVRYYADNPSFESLEYKQLRVRLQKYHIGSVIFGMHFNQAGPIKSSALDAAKVANQLQRDSKLPLLLAADLERGVASRLKDVPPFPWPMSFGAMGNTNEVERFGAVTAREARAIGVHWALAPVADVNNNPANPVIDDRSFAENAEVVGSLAVSFIRGAHEGGLLVTAKHFPGHGDSSTDSHKSIPTVEGDLAHLWAVEFPPFQRSIEAGVDSVLLAHARVPALDPDTNKIATISSRVVTDTLRGRLGFKGVVLTDAIEMQGITALYDPKLGSPTARAAVDAIKAGCDVIMVPTDLDGAFNAIVNAVRRGEISETRTDESVRRILQMKAAVGLHKSRFVVLNQVAAETSRKEDMEFAQHVSDEATTLVRDEGVLLPLKMANSLRARAGAPAVSSDSLAECGTATDHVYGHEEANCLCKPPLRELKARGVRGDVLGSLDATPRIPRCRLSRGKRSKRIEAARIRRIYFVLTRSCYRHNILLKCLYTTYFDLLGCF